MQSSKKITKGFIDDFISDSTQAELDLKADDADVVHDTGNETIAGTKTFTSQVIAPSYKTPTGTAAQFLKANGTVDTNTYAVNATVVHTTGNEGIAGTKTFTAIPVAPGFKTPTGTASQFLKANGSTDSTVYAEDADVVHNTGNESISGDKTFLDDVILPNLTPEVTSDFMTVGINTSTNELVTIPNGTQWMGEWTQQEYLPNQQVRDGGYLAVANTITEERPAPQGVGEPFNIYNGTIGTTTTTARQVLFGNKYTFLEDVFFEGWRAYLVAGNNYTVYLVRDPDGENIISQILQFVAQNSGWTQLNANTVILEAGSTYAAIVAVSEPAAVPVTFNGNWNMVQPQNVTVPTSGQITQPRSTPSLLYVNNIDNAAVNRAVELATLNIGDLITTDSNTWAIQSISPQTGYFIFGVSPALLNLSTGVQNFEFETKSTVTLTYALDPNYWLSNPPVVANVQGLLGVDVSYQSITPDDTAYGVGVLIQRLVKSNDWDIQASNGVSGGGNININGNSGNLFRTAQADTGVLMFGGLSTASTTQINIGVVKGVIVDNETNPLEPIYTFVDYPGETNKTVTTIGTGTATYVLIKTDKTIHFQNNFPTSQDRKEMIWLGKVSHPTSVTIAFTINEPDYITSPMAFSRDLFQVLGAYINDGVFPYANGANLQINITTGNIHGDGINFVNDRANPNELTVNATAPTTFFYRTQIGTGGGGVNLVDPTMYDNAGVITAVGGGINNTTIQYLFLVPGIGYVLQYGQTIYSTFSEAVQTVGKENSFIQYPNLVGNAVLLGVIVVKRTATALNDSTQARIFKADKLGQIVGAAGGSSVSSLQNAYNNSVQPEITTSSTLGAVTFKRGSAADTDSVMEGQNGAGTVTSNIDGNGKITGQTLVLNTYTVATLPTGVLGMTSVATDLLAPSYLGVAVGGGAVVGRVLYNGTNWIT